MPDDSCIIQCREREREKEEEKKGRKEEKKEERKCLKCIFQSCIDSYSSHIMMMMEMNLKL